MQSWIELMAKQDKLIAEKEAIAEQAKEMELKLKHNFYNACNGFHWNKEQWKRRATLYENIFLHDEIHVLRSTLDALEVDETIMNSTEENP